MIQKRIAASILKCSPKKISFDREKLDQIKEAITRKDVKLLIGKGIITKSHDTGISRARANIRVAQKKKGRRRGHGSRKGTLHASADTKLTWISRIRKQRTFIRRLKERGVLDAKNYHELYGKAKGGFFRSEHHIKLYLEEKGILKK
jgi:large subunit ribosomal protein L19e